MTVPTPPDDQKPGGQIPDGQQPGEQAAGDYNPWSPPPPGSAPVGQEPYPMPMAPVWAPQPRNGMGIAALVLGIISVVLGLFIILFWMSWLPALLALIFGFVGLSQVRRGLATNKGMAVTGVVLGAVGLVAAVGGGVFSAIVVDKVVDDARTKVEEAEASASAEAESEAAAEAARHLSFGKPYTFDGGLKVTVAKPEPFTPDAFAHGHAKGNKAIEVTVTVVNTGRERVAVETGLPDVNDADGASASLVIDGSGRQKVITGYLLPGRTAVGKYAFSLPPGAADKAEVEFSPDAARWDDAYWSGSLNGKGADDKGTGGKGADGEPAGPAAQQVSGPAGG
ncbi:DUF4190 domain-containing protein [Streptomyces pinistramenti]|uniref:DUF4190 domain-containing protein n=1 Tax=Streptomyces pinistramenti TaxID=2884812 RepID=UPI001D0807AD|nr:DUF4190 domain-containing protein [Streptomyces pinistramenti]MCB5911463.1 DUF4190 domain-containing protein [Streptomyces pinistramenti]